jgi:heptosyltransferase-2
MSVAFHPPPRRILVRGVNWLGDAVMTTPALLRLREKFPAAHITLLTPEKLADLWQHHPAVDEIVSISPEETVWQIAGKLKFLRTQLHEFAEGFRAGKAAFDISEKTPAQIVIKRTRPLAGDVPNSLRQIREQAFDLALVLPNSPRSALEVFLARIPQRVGYARPWRNFFLTQTVPPRAGAVKMRKRSVAEIKNLAAQSSAGVPPAFAKKAAGGTPAPHSKSHQIYEYLHLAAALGANPEPLPPQLFVAPEEITAVEKKFGLEQVAGPILGLNPGAEYGPAKRWPVERFISAAKEIQQKTNCIWLLFGGKSDTALANQIESAIGNRQSAINLAGKTSLRELMSLLKLCRVLLTNDTGPMHVAAALGTPVVVPFGSTSPELTGPIFSSNAQILKSAAPCSPCFLRECPIDFRCLNEISVERVTEAVLQIVLTTDGHG